MKINILLPYKEIFAEDKASSVSITVKNNLKYTKFSNNIQIFGQETKNPILSKNFFGIKYLFWSLKSKNYYLASQMLKIITKTMDVNQIIEIHNRPYLINYIFKKNKNFPLSLFLHNDPKEMKGSKSSTERKKILERCASIYCVSNFIKNQFLDGITYNQHKVHVLHNGVHRKLKEFPLKKKEILFVGRIVPEKGVGLYIDVITNIAKEFPDWNFGLIGSFKLGDNNQNDVYSQEKINKFKKIGKQAKFYGFKKQTFVYKKMKDASIIIIPSLWKEPFGLVAAEAMSNGIAIIASSVGGLPEIIKENGILIEKINFIKLRSALLELLNNKKIRLSFQKKSWDNFEFSALKSSEKLDNYRQQIIQDFF